MALTKVIGAGLGTVTGNVDIDGTVDMASTLALGGDLTTATDVNIIIQGTHNEGGALLDLKGTDTPADAKNLGSLSFGNSTDRSLAMIRGVSEASDAAGLRFYTEATGAAIEERMRISSTGIITKPYQPCFSATADTTNIPLQTQTTIALSGERFDIGNNLDANTFTAPVTAKYLFCYIFYFSSVDADHTTLDVHIKTSNKQYQQTFSPDHFFNSDSNFSVSGSMICDMDASDTCIFTTYVQAGAAQTDIHTDSQVSGVLIC